MANSHETLTSLFTDIANSIRSKTGKSNAIVADNFPSEIDTITAGGNLQEKTVTPTGRVLTVFPDEGYDGMSTVTVEGDTNLTAQNIAEGITIYGVTGALKGGGEKAFETSATGRIPDYERGYATTELASNMFETFATGEVVS